MATSTLLDIKKLVRDLTRMPTINQLSDADLEDYINTVYLFNFQGVNALFPLRKVVTFYTQPNVDVYETTTVDVTDPLYDFKNRYPVVHRPIYIAGVIAFFTEWRTEFYANYPQTNFNFDTLLRGDGTVGPFIGTLVQRPALQNSVVFSCLDLSDTAMVVVDTPVDNITGILSKPNDQANPLGSINYITGAFTLSFPAATKIGAPINGTTIGYAAGIPVQILFFEDKFTLRPVPDKVYTVQIEVDARPTEIMNDADIPLLKQWWQYIAALTGKYIADRRGDSEMRAQIEPYLKEQEDLVNRPTLSQKAEMRSQTIFTQGGPRMWNWFGRWPY
jgi:hypothetical protein